MVKKKVKSNDTDMDLDLGDMDDFGDDMSFGDEDSVDDIDRKPSRSKVVTDLAKEAGEEALSTAIKKTAAKALPEEYSNNYYDALDIANFTTEVIDKNKTALNKSAFKLGKEVKKILPFKVGILDKYLEDKQSEFETARSQSEEEMRDAGVKSNLNDIFDKQLEVQKSLYARSEAKDQVANNEKMVRDNMSQDVLANIDGNIAHQTAFTTQISKEYYRRSLELQFKSYYVQADALKTMRDHYKAFSIQFTNIEKNTALPDFVKLKNTEKLHDIMREQTVKTLYSNTIGKSKYLKNMKAKASGFVSGKVGELTEKIDGITDLLGTVNSADDGSGEGTAAMIRSLAAGLAGSTVGEKLADKFGPKAKNLIKDNKYINAGGNMLGTLGNSPSTLLESLKSKVNKKVDSVSDEATPGRWLSSKLFGGAKSLLDASTPGGEELKVKGSGYLEHNQPAIFDNKVHRSITEVIPLYLSKILQTNTNLTTMYSNVNGGISGGAEELNYDYGERKLDNNDNIARNIKESILADKSIGKKAKLLSTSILSTAKNTSESSTGSKDEKKKDKDLLSSKKSQAALSSYMEKAAEASNGEMTFDSLFVNTANDPFLADILSKDAELAKLIDTIKRNKSSSTEMINLKLKDVSNTYPIEAIKQLFLTAPKMMGSQVENVLSKDSATGLSMGFFDYIRKSGKDVVPASVISGEAFLEIPPKFMKDDLQKNISIFSNAINRIVDYNDSQLLTTLELLFSVMNKSLREDRDLDVSVLQNLSELAPQIVGKGTINITNLKEGNLKISSENEKGDRAWVMNAINARPADDAGPSGFVGPVRPNRVETAIDRTISQVRDTANFTRQNITNPKVILDAAKSRFKDIKTTVTDSLKEKTAVLEVELGKLNAKFGASFKDLERRGLVIIIEQYEKVGDRLQSVIIDMRVELEELDAKLQGLANQVNGTTEGATAGETATVINSFKALKQNNIKLLESALETVNEQKKKLIDLQSSGETLGSKRIATMRAAIVEGLTAFKAALKSYETEGGNITL